MNGRTNLSVVAMGGAVAFVLLYLVQLSASLLAEHDVQFPTGLESALATLITAVLAYVLPEDALTKIKARTTEDPPQ